MTFPHRVNDDLFYRDLEGREGFVVFNRTKKLAYFGPNIASADGHAFPPGYSAEALRHVADHLDALPGDYEADSGEGGS